MSSLILRLNILKLRLQFFHSHRWARCLGAFGTLLLQPLNHFRESTDRFCKLFLQLLLLVICVPQHLLTYLLLHHGPIQFPDQAFDHNARGQMSITNILPIGTRRSGALRYIGPNRGARTTSWNSSRAAWLQQQQLLENISRMQELPQMETPYGQRYQVSDCSGRSMKIQSPAFTEDKLKLACVQRVDDYSREHLCVAHKHSLVRSLNTGKYGQHSDAINGGLDVPVLPV
mmetsp:Transcript_25740/g.59519  ORF Transcript_25740/g.59519 Transcript_25740/m.59519 type:complete len:230 (+) Transcript_25740:975-1664(+)